MKTVLKPAQNDDSNGIQIITFEHKINR